MGKLITALIMWGLFFGVVGGLTDVVRAMRDQAVQAHKLGFISLVRLNRALNK